MSFTDMCKDVQSIPVAISTHTELESESAVAIVVLSSVFRRASYIDSAVSAGGRTTQLTRISADPSTSSAADVFLSMFRVVVDDS